MLKALAPSLEPTLIVKLPQAGKVTIAACHLQA